VKIAPEDQPVTLTKIPGSATPPLAAADGYQGYTEIPLLRSELSLLRVAITDPNALSGAIRAVIEAADTPLSAATEAVEDETDEVEEVVAALVARFTATAGSIAVTDREVLLPRYDTGQQRLLTDTGTAIASGLASSGRAQREDFRDALVILQGLADSPTGRRDYGVWMRIGWLRRKTNDSLAHVEEAFYQAARLSRAAGDAYYPLAARQVAAVQAMMGRDIDAAETLEAALAVAPSDPILLWSAARIAAARGRADEAVALVDRCLAAEPPLTLLLFVDPGLETERAAIADALDRRRTTARARTATAIERWRRAVALVRRVEEKGGVPMPLPTSLTEEAIPSAVEADDPALTDRAGDVIACATKTLAGIIADARAHEGRVRRTIEMIHQDKEKWEGILVTLKAEAEMMNVSLDHPPVPKGLLRKKDPNHEQVFLNFHVCRQSLTRVDAQMRENLPELRVNLTKAVERSEHLEQTAAYLAAQASALS
jgi:tetratricopeptide (TPR) repeat protein